METAATDMIRLEYENGVATVILANPPLNALCREVMDGLDISFATLLREDSLRAVIVTGQGKAFVAGADLKEVSNWSSSEAQALTAKGQRIFRKIETFPVPVIAAINGFAFGGGLELALACDIRIASKNASMGLPEVGLGIIPGYGGTQRLARLIGPGKAKRIIFSGESVTAAEAYRMGLVEQVAARDTLMKEATALATAIAAKGPVAVRCAKRAVNANLDRFYEEGIAFELKMARACFGTEDRYEGVAAFIEKRPPIFNNR